MITPKKYLPIIIENGIFLNLYKKIFKSKNDLNRSVQYAIRRFAFSGDWIEKPLCEDKYNVKFDVHLIGFEYINTKETKRLITVTVVVRRPGILIGKSGSVIAALENYLTDNFKKHVHIRIIESELLF